MELSILLAEQIVALFLMMVVGYAVVKIGLFETEDSKVISNIVVYICCPCVVVSSFQIELTQDKAVGFVIAIIASIVVHIFMIGLTNIGGKILHFNGIEKASVIYSNSGNLIIPLVGAVLGEEWVFYTCAYLVVQTILIWTHGVGIITESGVKELKKIIMNPNIIAILFGLILFVTGWKLPSPIGSCVSAFGQMVGPASMLVIGMLIGKADFVWVFKQKRLYLLSFIRLIAFPTILMLIFAFAARMGIHKDAEYILLIVLLAASAPVAATVTQMAQIYGKDSNAASVINVMTVICCIITMPLIAMGYEAFF